MGIFAGVTTIAVATAIVGAQLPRSSDRCALLRIDGFLHVAQLDDQEAGRIPRSGQTTAVVLDICDPSIPSMLQGLNEAELDLFVSAVEAGHQVFHLGGDVIRHGQSSKGTVIAIFLLLHLLVCQQGSRVQTALAAGCWSCSTVGDCALRVSTGTCKETRRHQ